MSENVNICEYTLNIFFANVRLAYENTVFAHQTKKKKVHKSQMFNANSEATSAFVLSIAATFELRSVTMPRTLRRIQSNIQTIDWFSLKL